MSMKLVPRVLVKIVVLGEGGVGKTTLSKYIEKNVVSTTSQTIGMDFHVKHLVFKSFPCTVQLWDFGGQDQFKNMGIFSKLCEGAKGAFVCFDLSDLNTYNQAQDWLNFLPAGTPFVVVGTKADLVNNRMAKMSDLDLFRTRTGFISYFETRIDDTSTIDSALASLLEIVLCISEDTTDTPTTGNPIENRLTPNERHEKVLATSPL